ncbi:MAG: AAA family ATPase [Phycisphaerae bacterium]|nr:AAA family ATPase [Phycisphaerae bacterium]
MSQKTDGQLILRPGGSGSDVPDPPPPVVRRRLSPGWVLGGLALGATLGAVGGFFSTSPVYRSQSVLQVEPVGLPGSSPTAARLRAAARRHAAELSDRAAVDAVVKSLPERARRDGAERALAVVDLPGAAGQVQVSWEGADREAAAGAVRRLVSNYVERWTAGDEAKWVEQVEQALERQQEAEVQRADWRQKRAELREDHGPTPAAEGHAASIAALAEIDRLVRRNELALSAARARPAWQPEDTDVDLVILRLARTDEDLARLVEQKQELSRKLEELGRTMGRNAPPVVEARMRQEEIESGIEQRLQAIRLARTAEPDPATAAGAEPWWLLTTAELEARRDTLQKLRDGAEVDVAAWAKKAGRLQEVESEIRRWETAVDRARTDLEKLTARAGVVGRVVVLQEAKIPLQPVRDGRPVAAAVGAGTVGLIGLGLGALIAAFRDPRLRRAEKAVVDAATAPLLGAVPEVQGEAGEDADKELTAMAIHEIRALLEVRARQVGTRSLAITSADPGSGKTSVAVGLASSLALSGTRVLLVDCDLAGRARSASAGDGDAEPSEQRLEQVMLQMGFLDESDTELFLFDEGAKVGLVGMLDGGSLQECAIDTNIGGLSLLPALSARPQHVGGLSCRFIRQLIDQARTCYDLVIFDSGCVPGSVEALFVASEVDEVVLVVGRGERQSRFNRAVAYLKMIGANLAGTVFNRALLRDLQVASSDPARRRAASESAMLPGARRTRRVLAHGGMGSGILAAAVHSEAGELLGGPAAHVDGLRETAAGPRGATASSDTAQPSTEAAGGMDQTLKPEDAGDILSVLLEDEEHRPAPVSPIATVPLTESAGSPGPSGARPASPLTADAAMTPSSQSDDDRPDRSLKDLAAEAVASVEQAAGGPIALAGGATLDQPTLAGPDATAQALAQELDHDEKIHRKPPPDPAAFGAEDTGQVEVRTSSLKELAEALDELAGTGTPPSPAPPNKTEGAGTPSARPEHP